MPVFVVLSKRRAVGFLFCIFALGFIFGVRQERTVAVEAEAGLWQDALWGIEVVVDAGHGGPDPGAVSPSGMEEEDVTLAVARALAGLLEDAGATPILLREGDYDLADPDAAVRKVQDLSRRIAAANESGADLYISLHVNAFSTPGPSGAQTFYEPTRDSDRRLAEAIQAELSRLRPTRRQARPGDYRVLRETRMPAAMVELGFLSNPQEAELLSRPVYQHDLAAAILRGILAYLSAEPPEVAAVTPGDRRMHL